MLTDKEIKKLIEDTYKVATDVFKTREEVDNIFLNLKAHLQSQDITKDIISLVNGQLVKHGESTIKISLKKDSAKVIVGPLELNERIKKHFDFDMDDLYYTTIDFFSQIYEEGGFSTSVVFLNKDRSEAEVHISL